MEFIEDFLEEAEDFFEDFFEHAVRRHPSKPKKERRAVINGTVAQVRPAYIFAERIDNFVRIVFGVSIIISALTATFLGFQTMSDLLAVLIGSLWGRAIMLIIGLSYFIIAIWKLMHIKDKN